MSAPTCWYRIVSDGRVRSEVNPCVSTDWARTQSALARAIRLKPARRGHLEVYAYAARDQARRGSWSHQVGGPEGRIPC